MKNKKIVFVILVLIAGVLLLLSTKTKAITQMTSITKTMEEEKARLSWNKVEGASGYEVHVNIPGIGYTYLGAVTNNKATIKGFTKGVIYRVKVRAFEMVNGKKQYSSYSNEVPMEIEITSLAQVENFTVEVVDKKAKLKWDEVENAYEYEVYVNVPGKGYIYLGSTNGTGGAIQGFTENVDYYIKVRALNYMGSNNKYGEYSEEKLVRIEGESVEPPKEPENPGDNKPVEPPKNELKFIKSVTTDCDTISVIISTAAGGGKGGDLNYTIEYGTTQNYGISKTYVGTSEKDINIFLKDLSNYQKYYYKITVTDGKDTIEKKGTFTTKCGEVAYCPGGKENINNVCKTCNGTR